MKRLPKRGRLRRKTKGRPQIEVGSKRRPSVVTSGQADDSDAGNESCSLSLAQPPTASRSTLTQLGESGPHSDGNGVGHSVGLQLGENSEERTGSSDSNECRPVLKKKRRTGEAGFPFEQRALAVRNSCVASDTAAASSRPISDSLRQERPENTEQHAEIQMPGESPDCSDSEIGQLLAKIGGEEGTQDREVQPRGLNLSSDDGATVTGSARVHASTSENERIGEVDLGLILQKNNETLRLRGFFRYDDRMRSARKNRGKARLHDQSTLIDQDSEANQTSGRGSTSRRRLPFYQESEDESDSSSSSIETYSESQLKLRRSWRKAVKTLDKRLLVSDPESRMEGQHASPRKPGEQGYVALPVSEENNSDIARIYEIRYLPMASRGHPTSAYPNLKSCLGQYIRLCVCLRLIDVLNVWKPAALFNLLLNRSAVEIFLTYFRLRGQPTTVGNKAANLKKAVHHASLYFGDQPSLSAAAHEMMVTLSQFRSAERREYRRTSRGTEEDRMAAGKLLDETDMRDFGHKAFAKCAAIVRSATGDGDPARFMRHRVHGEKLVNKWCINLLAFLMLEGNGQRPQVYCQLIVPDPGEIDKWRNGEVSLRTSLEKTPRSQECPAVLFPKRAAKLLQFHIDFVRPEIVERNGNIEEHLSEVPLLLNTSSGEMLTTEEVRNTLRTFLTSYDPELKHITPMVLRSSFASIMFAKYKRGEAGRGKSVEAFLSDLAKLMNTSTEMLSATYVASNPHDFPSSVVMLFKAFQTSDAESHE